MNALAPSRFLRKHGLSAFGLAGLVLVLVGFFLGVSVHMGFLALVAAGAFGPGALRTCGLLDDLDELQREAALRAAHRAWLVSGGFLVVVVIARQWGTLRLGDDLVPASLVLTLLLVVYGESYVLSFWDAPKAAFVSLLAVGLFWLTFTVLSHASDPLAAVVAGSVVAGPAVASALLVRRWPRAVGLTLVAVSIWLCFFLHLIPSPSVPTQQVYSKLFVLVLLPVPLATLGLALLGRGRLQER